MAPSIRLIYLWCAAQIYQFNGINTIVCMPMRALYNCNIVAALLLCSVYTTDMRRPCRHPCKYIMSPACDSACARAHSLDNHYNVTWWPVLCPRDSGLATLPWGWGLPSTIKQHPPACTCRQLGTGQHCLFLNKSLVVCTLAFCVLR